MMKKNQIISERLRKNKGFTLIEVIAVLVIIAIISTVVVVRGISTADVNVQAEVDTLKAHLRYAQYLALNENDTGNSGNPVRWGIDVDGSGSSYTLINENGPDPIPFNLPNESSITHSFEPISASDTTVLFDQWGSPGVANIDITLGGKTITITAGTGYIQ